MSTVEPYLGNVLSVVGKKVGQLKSTFFNVKLGIEGGDLVGLVVESRERVDDVGAADPVQLVGPEAHGSLAVDRPGPEVAHHLVVVGSF